MHELFTQVLSSKDLSKAGDLFALSDAAVVADLPEVVKEISRIASSGSYLTSDNDQSVVEICVARVTSAARETGTVALHGASLVALLESCLEHGLETDSPHAKIAADVISCLYLSHEVLASALPVAVRFLQRRNAALSRTLSSYLSLAAADHAPLLAKHTALLVSAVLEGSHSLARVLPPVYVVAPEDINRRVSELGKLVARCGTQDKLALLTLLALVAQADPTLLASSLSSLCEQLTSPATVAAALNVLLAVATKQPRLLTPHLEAVKLAAERHPQSLGQAAQVISLAGAVSQSRAQDALDFVLAQLPGADRAAQAQLLRVATAMCSRFPALFTERLLADVRATHTDSSSSVTSGPVTIVKLGGNSTAATQTTQTPHSFATGTRTTQGDSAWPGRLVATRPRLNGGDSRSTGRLHTTPHRSMTRLNTAAGGLHKSLTRLGPRQTSDKALAGPSNVVTNVNTAVAGGRSYAVQPARAISSGGVTVTTPKLPMTLDRDVALVSASAPLSLTLPAPRAEHGARAMAARRPHAVTTTTVNQSLVAEQRMSVFEPFPMRDTVQHFCEKHLDKIKVYMRQVSFCVPPPAKCTIEERRAKKLARLHFACGAAGSAHCLYTRAVFSMATRHPRTWIHLMFLALQARCLTALSSRDASVAALKNCWDILKCDNKTFLTVVTSAFPCTKEQDLLLNELRHSGYFDVFECSPATPGPGLGDPSNDMPGSPVPSWGCFLCSHPERAVGFLQDSQPVIEGVLQEKKGRWRLFRRWRTRYFTLSGAHLTYKGSKDDVEGTRFEVDQIRSVKVSRGPRSIPRAFEVFTGDRSLVLKPANGPAAQQWVQCLSVAVALREAPNRAPL